MGLTGNVFFGTNGSDTITDTNVHQGSDFSTGGVWVAIEVVTDTVFTQLVPYNSDHPSKNGLTVSAGRFIYGVYKTIQLASGSVEAYRSIVKD